MDDFELISKAKEAASVTIIDDPLVPIVHQLCSRLNHWIGVSQTITSNYQERERKAEDKDQTIWALQGAHDDLAILHEHQLAEAKRHQEHLVAHYKNEAETAANANRVLRHIIKQVKDQVVAKDVLAYIDMMMGALASGHAHISSEEHV